MQRRNLAVPVKLWALLWTIMGISLTGNAMLTCVLTAACFLYLAVQKNWRLMGGFALFYGILALLLYLIRYHGLHMVVFSEVYVLMFWNLSPVFLGGPRPPGRRGSGSSTSAHRTRRTPPRAGPETRS